MCVCVCSESCRGPKRPPAGRRPETNQRRRQQTTCKQVVFIYALSYCRETFFFRSLSVCTASSFANGSRRMLNFGPVGPSRCGVATALRCCCCCAASTGWVISTRWLGEAVRSHERQHGCFTNCTNKKWQSLCVRLETRLRFFL